MGKGYKVGDLDVTISGVSKDAVDSLDAVITKLDQMVGTLGVVSKGFGGAFKNINTSAVSSVVQDFEELTHATRSAASGVKDLAGVIKNGQESAQQAFGETRQEVRRTSEEYDNLFKIYRKISDSTKDKTILLGDIKTAEENVKSAEMALKSLQAQLVSAFERGTTELAFKLLPELEKAGQRVSVLQDRVDELRKAFGAPFNEAQAQVSKLTTEMRNLHFVTGNIDEKSIEQFQNLTEQINKTNEAFKRMAMTEQELVLYDFQQENAIRKQRIAYLNLMLTTGQAGEKTREYTQELKQLINQQQIADKVAGKSATGGFSKLIKQIGRIALYRTIRRGLQMITQTFRESIQAYAQVDDNINKMMSQLTSSTKIIQLSLGTIIFPILQAITPVVQQISVGFANMANAINKSMALAQGNATYTKINTDALKDYRKELNKTSGALFDFDKFRALSSKQDTASIFLSTEETTALDKAEQKYSGIYTLISGIGDLLSGVLGTIEKIGSSTAFQTIMTVVGYTVGGLVKAAGWLLDILNTSGLLEPILGGILGYLTYISATKIFLALSGGKLLAWLKAVVSLLRTDFSGTLKMLAGDFAKVMSSTKMLAISIGALATSIAYLVMNWDDMSNTGRTLTITLSAIAAAIVGIFTALVAVKWAGLGIGAAIKAGLSAAALTAAIGIAIGTAASTAKSNIPQYAKGASDIDGGAVFIAGEAGKTEMVYSGENGKANVANVQQMYQAEYMAVLQALKDYGAARGEMPQLQPASDTGIYQAASRGAGKAGKKFANY